MYLGTIVPFVIASVAGSWSHSLSQAAADAAVLASEEAPVLGQVSTVRPLISTGVGGVRSHSVTQTTALGTGLTMGLAVGLGKIRTVRVLVNTRLGCGLWGISRASNLNIIHIEDFFTKDSY